MKKKTYKGNKCGMAFIKSKCKGKKKCVVREKRKCN